MCGSVTAVSRRYSVAQAMELLDVSVEDLAGMAGISTHTARVVCRFSKETTAQRSIRLETARAVGFALGMCHHCELNFGGLSVLDY